MTERTLHISCLVLFLSVFYSSGQEMPSLGVADEIKKGTFPNGLEYYLVSNSVEKGFADMALVSKQVFNETSDRKLLDSLPHLGSRAPYRFLADNGIGYSQYGYMMSMPASKVFSLERVPMYNSSVADSTLMLVLGIASTSSSPQAVIVSGDIDVTKIQERIALFSMMVPPLRRAEATHDYQWNPTDSLRMIVSYNSTDDVAAINAIFRAQRLPLSQMNTIQPLISEAYSYILGRIVEQRLEEEFRNRDIPLAQMRFEYIDSSQSSDHEYYSFSLFTSADCISEATSALASVLASIDKYGVSLDEFEDAKLRLTARTKRLEYKNQLTNSEYVKKCIASYLYGANLASEGSVNTFLTGRSLPIERERALFNSFAAAVLDSTKNLTLRYDVPYRGIARNRMRATFFESWASATAGGEDFRAISNDTSAFYLNSKRVRLRSESEEPVSGGKIWTFANGVRVLYKQMDTSGEFYYSLMLRGGVASVPNLASGEGAFVGDMLLMSRIAGMKGRDFLSILSANGISMEARANLSELCISGMAPKNRMPMLLRALLAVANNRSSDQEEFEYYRKTEALRIDMGALSPRNVNSLIDSIMRPNYFYSQRKSIANLGEDLPQRAEQFFASEFSKLNDGILIIVGDLDEEVLKKELSRTVGRFVCNVKYSVKPKVSSRFTSGSVTYMSEALPGLVGGGEIGVNIGFSASISYSLDNYIAFKAAVACIKKEIVKNIADVGAYAMISDKLELFPTERMFFYVNAHPCRSSGLPLSVEAEDPLSVLSALRKVTKNLNAIEISSTDLQAFKEEILSDFERSCSDPESLIELIIMRYSKGKDLATNFSKAVQNLSIEDVRKILSLLQEGAEVEYVII